MKQQSAWVALQAASGRKKNMPVLSDFFSSLFCLYLSIIEMYDFARLISYRPLQRKRGPQGGMEDAKYLEFHGLKCAQCMCIL